MGTEHPHTPLDLAHLGAIDVWRQCSSRNNDSRNNDSASADGTGRGNGTSRDGIHRHQTVLSHEQAVAIAVATSQVSYESKRLLRSGFGYARPDHLMPHHLLYICPAMP
jgi:hypothetical protein